LKLEKEKRGTKKGEEIQGSITISQHSECKCKRIASGVPWTSEKA
jgi:hypothetical protein